MDFVKTVYLPWAKQNKSSWYDDVLWSRAVEPWFKGKTFAQISPLMIEKFKKERRESITKRGTQRSVSTVNRELEILSKVFNLAIDHGVTSDNPCLKIKRFRLDNRRPRYLYDDEEPQLMATLTGQRAHLRPMVIVAIGTGMRKGDQLNLLWEKVDFQRNVIYVPNSKTGRDYPVPMNEDVRAVLLALRREAKGSEYVFISPKTGKPYTDVKGAFAHACSLAGINDLHWHDLRHTFGTRLAEGGFSESTIAELMGHSAPKTTRRYTHATERAKHEAVEAARVGTEKTCHNPATNEKRPAVRLAVSN